MRLTVHLYAKLLRWKHSASKKKNQPNQPKKCRHEEHFQEAINIGTLRLGISGVGLDISNLLNSKVSVCLEPVHYHITRYELDTPESSYKILTCLTLLPIASGKFCYRLHDRLLTFHKRFVCLFLTFQWEFY